jgi:hypothetical protein
MHPKCFIHTSTPVFVLEMDCVVFQETIDRIESHVQHDWLTPGCGADVNVSVSVNDNFKTVYGIDTTVQHKFTPFNSRSSAQIFSKQPDTAGRALKSSTLDTSYPPTFQDSSPTCTWEHCAVMFLGQGIRIIMAILWQILRDWRYCTILAYSTNNHPAKVNMSTVPVRDQHPDCSPHTAGLPQLCGRQTTGMASRSRPNDQAVETTGRICPDCNICDCHNPESLRYGGQYQRRRRTGF